MRKGLAILTLILSLGKGIDSYAQSPQDSIPGQIKKEVADYLKGINYCQNIKIVKVGEKLESITGSKISLYTIENCDAIPSYFVFKQRKLKEGGFSESGSVESIYGKDGDFKKTPLKLEDL
jgi:hypothetical protein